METPAVPPRPARSKSPLHAPQQSSPAIPPRPAARSKSPAVVPAPDDDGFVVVTSESDQQQDPQQQPALKTIPPSTELHAPVALSSRPAAVPRAESDTSVSASTTAPHTPSHGRYSSSAAAAAAASTEDREKEGIPQIGRRVPMYPNAGDVQAPTPTETPSSSKKKHVYREEWEMNEGAYGQKRRETPYSMLLPGPSPLKTAPKTSLHPLHPLSLHTTPSYIYNVYTHSLFSSSNLSTS